MPKVMIWIRKEDYDKWLVIANKPEWLHNRLQTISVAELEKIDSKVIKTPQDAQAAVKPLQKQKKTEPITYQKKTNWGA